MICPSKQKNLFDQDEAVITIGVPGGPPLTRASIALHVAHELQRVYATLNAADDKSDYIVDTYLVSMTRNARGWWSIHMDN
jgi:hypothetical protein